MEDRLAASIPVAAPPGPAPRESAAPGAGDESPYWPEGTTAVAITKAPDAGPPVSPAPPAGAEGPLPALETLVARIPADVREALDDLFRVKFINVQRLPSAALKSPVPPAG